MHKLLEQRISRLQGKGVQLKTCQKCPVCQQEKTCTWIIVPGNRAYYSEYWFQPEEGLSADWDELFCCNDPQSFNFYSRDTLERAFVKGLARGLAEPCLQQFEMMAHQMGVKMRQDSTYLKQFASGVLKKTYSPSEPASEINFICELALHIERLDRLDR